MFISSAHFLAWLLQYKYWALFPLMVVGGPVVQVLSGSLVAAKILNFLITFLIVLAADLTGDSIYYVIGRFGGLKFIRRYGQYFGLDANRVTAIENHFSNHGGRTLILGKITQAFGAIVLVSAGVAKMPYLQFLFYNLVATVLKSLFLLLVGYYFLAIYLRLHQYSIWATLIFIILTLLGILVYYMLRNKNLKKLI